jgi:hypothetical protein
MPLSAGEFKMGMMDGPGLYTYQIGASYHGKFRKGFKSDKEGIFKYNNGDRYVGRFHNNMPYGRGRLWIHRNFIPKDVWNGELVEIDPRPSQMGAFTNFNIDEDIPVEYQDTSSQEGTSSSESSSGDDSSTLRTHGGCCSFNADGTGGASPSGEGSVRSQRSRYTLTSLDDLHEHK